MSRHALRLQNVDAQVQSYQNYQNLRIHHHHLLRWVPRLCEGGSVLVYEVDNRYVPFIFQSNNHSSPFFASTIKSSCSHTCSLGSVLPATCPRRLILYLSSRSRVILTSFLIQFLSPSCALVLASHCFGLTPSLHSRDLNSFRLLIVCSY